jgi:hypothetical protein
MARISLPATITARYVDDQPWDEDTQDSLPGVIVVEFGGYPFAEIKVSPTDHYNLTQYYRYDVDREEREEREVSRIVAQWLGERLK